MSSWTKKELEEILRGNPLISIEEEPKRKKIDISGKVGRQLELEMLDKRYHELKKYREKVLLESEVQSNFVRWVRNNREFYRPLQSGFAVPNGGKRPMKTAVTMKKEGLEKGVSDYFFTRPARGYSGLVIEFKVKYNKPTEEQVEWLNRFIDDGFYCVVAWSEMDAQEITCWFYDLPRGLY